MQLKRNQDNRQYTVSLVEPAPSEDAAESADRKRIVLLIGGVLTIMLAIFIAVYLLRDRTKAAAGAGGAVVITPDRIGQISDEVSGQVMDTLSADVLADMVSKSAAEELTTEKIRKLISKKDLEFVQISQEDLQDKIAEMLKELGISGDNVLTEEQKDYIGFAVDKILRQSLTHVSVTQLLSDEEKNRLAEQLKQELSQMLKEQIQNSACSLSDQELARLKDSLNLEKLVKNLVDSMIKQQLEKMQSNANGNSNGKKADTLTDAELKKIQDKVLANIISNMNKDGSTPIKGGDYFTDAELKGIQDNVLGKASEQALTQIEGLTAQVGEVKEYVSQLTKQLQSLKETDSEQTGDLEKMRNSIEEINTSIWRICSLTEKLTGDITVSQGNLEQVSGSGSELVSAKVDTSDMTIAQFVDILAGNDQVYTGAIKELHGVVNQLKEKDASQDQEFEKSIQKLEASLDDSSKEMKDTKGQLENSDQELKRQLEKSSQELKQQSEKSDQDLRLQMQEQESENKKQLEAEKKARQEADDKLQSQADAADGLIGDAQSADGVQGSTIFEKIGTIVRALSADGIPGLLNALQNAGGANTLEEGINNISTDLTDARARVEKLEKEKWHSNITLLAGEAEEGAGGYMYQESGSAYVYRIPIVEEADQIDLSSDDTSIVVEFQKPGRLPSNAAFSTAGNDLLITFTNKPTRNIKVTTIHVYKEYKNTDSQ